MSRSLVLAATLLIFPPLTIAQQRPQRPPTSTQPTDNAVDNALRNIVSEIRYDATPLGDVISDLSRRLNVKVRVSWKQFEGFAAGPETQVTMHLRDVPALQLVELILLDATASCEVHATVENGGLVIGSHDNTADTFITRTYALHDLLPPERPASDDWEQLPLQFEDPSIEHLLTYCVEPDTWANNGGEATIKRIGPIAVIHQSPRVHEQVADLLAALRRVPPRGTRWVPDSLEAAQQRSVNTLALLRRPLARVTFDGVPFCKAASDLGKRLGVGIHVLSRDFTENGISPDTPVTLDLHDVSGESALQQLLQNVQKDSALAFDVRGNVVVIGTVDLLDARQDVRVYDLSDIVTSRRSANQVAELLVQTVEPDTWVENGGMASCKTFRTRLVIAQSLRVHRLIDALLTELRTTHRK